MNQTLHAVDLIIKLGDSKGLIFVFHFKDGPSP